MSSYLNLACHVKFKKLDITPALSTWLISSGDWPRKKLSVALENSVCGIARIRPVKVGLRQSRVFFLQHIAILLLRLCACLPTSISTRSVHRPLPACFRIPPLPRLRAVPFFLQWHSHSTPSEARALRPSPSLRHPLLAIELGEFGPLRAASRKQCRRE